MVENLVTFYTDSPEYKYQDAKYVFYLPFFPDLEDSGVKVDDYSSNGWADTYSEDQRDTTPVKRSDFRYVYTADGVDVLAIWDVKITLSGAFDDQTYTLLDHPDNVRLVRESAHAMKLMDRVTFNVDGTPDLIQTKNYRAIKFMFNSFPKDKLLYQIDIYESPKKIVRSQSGIIEIVKPPWE